jgi:hypothetical protein
MSRVEDRTAHFPPSPLVREVDTSAEPLELDAEPGYDSLPIKPTRSVAVVVRRVAKLAPRRLDVDEQG